MKYIKQSSLFMALIMCLSALHARAQAWNFRFGFTNVLAANALNYVVGQTNIAIINEGDGDTYWCPINDGTPATLTQEFTFPEPTTQAFLNAELSSFNFGSWYGSGSLWGSKDGTNWVMLLTAPAPSSPGFGTNYTTNLPNALIGSTQIWIQARLETTGYHIMAQYLRQYSVTSGTNNIFELDVQYAPQINFVKAFTVDYSNLLIGLNYQAQASPDLVNWTNWGTTFIATNSSYINTNYQRIADWNLLFFRLVQQ